MSEWEVRVLTREEIMNMKPGRELDALAAEKVMGWRKKTFPGGGGGFTAWVDENEKVMKLISNSTMSETCYRCDYFRPSTDIAAAWEVVEKMSEQWPQYQLAKIEDGWSVMWGFDGYGWPEATGKTAPEAICKAALLAVMDGEDETHD